MRSIKREKKEISIYENWIIPVNRPVLRGKTNASSQLNMKQHKQLWVGLFFLSLDWTIGEVNNFSRPRIHHWRSVLINCGRNRWNQMPKKLPYLKTSHNLESLSEILKSSWVMTFPNFYFGTAVNELCQNGSNDQRLWDWFSVWHSRQRAEYCRWFYIHGCAKLETQSQWAEHCRWFYIHCYVIPRSLHPSKIWLIERIYFFS